MKRFIKFIFATIFFVLFGLTFFSGCGVKEPVTQFVEGTVLLDGQPLGDATVGLTPVSGGLPGIGLTNAQGVFHLTAVQGGAANAGVPEGEYAVTVSKQINIAPQPKPEELGQDNISMKYPPDFKELVPEKYVNSTTTELKANIIKGKNILRFELNSQNKSGNVSP
ncbi:MAG: carboxypeptidase-like regulatory domain-containing protein [Planctomycetaceae bacterium]|jgi:hypothetical protein|nr:carboxypeptidase-like regulatory domain-containing protein [Planctomycetaceae bacterium]